MTLGKLVGKGNTAEVYEWGEHEVIKIFHERIPDFLIKKEFETNLQIQNMQLPSPKVASLIEMDGKKGIIYEKVVGPSLTKLLSQNPFSLKKKAQLFAGLHRGIHETFGTDLPKQKDYLVKNINGTDFLSADEKAAICTFLAELPDGGTSVCHGDFHPDNILVSEQQVKVIDWMTATCGNPIGDVARTYIIFKYAYLPKSMPFLIRLMLEFVRNQFCKHYLNYYQRLSADFSKEEMEKWLLPVMAARLVEGIHPDEKKVLLAQIRVLYKKYVGA